MKAKSTQKRSAGRKPASTSRRKPAPSIRTDELGALLEEIKEYISSLTRAHEQLNESLEGILGKVNHLEGRLQKVDTVVSKLDTLEDEVHQTVYGHSERISALEQRAA